MTPCRRSARRLTLRDEKFTPLVQDAREWENRLHVGQRRETKSRTGAIAMTKTSYIKIDPKHTVVDGWEAVRRLWRLRWHLYEPFPNGTFLFFRDFDDLAQFPAALQEVQAELGSPHAAVQSQHPLGEIKRVIEVPRAYPVPPKPPRPRPDA